MSRELIYATGSLGYHIALDMKGSRAKDNGEQRQSETEIDERLGQSGVPCNLSATTSKELTNTPTGVGTLE